MSSGNYNPGQKDKQRY